MRLLIVFFCLATAYAANLGYDYQRGAENLSGSLPAPVNPGIGALNDASSFQPEIASAPTEFTKEFYTYSAPNEAFDDKNGLNQLANSAKHNLRVVFIKTPENNGLENAALQLAKSINGQHTAIYVLTKQTDIGDLANKLSSQNHNNNNKPDVHFVKYRTPEDAENAQRVIQSQYDSLGGPSKSVDGGVAPVLDFASKAPLSGSLQASEPGSSYLPPSKRA